MNTEITYEDAIKELNLIVAQLEDGEMPIDQMGEKIKHSLHLIQICKTKLQTTNENIQEIIGEIME